MKMNRQFMCKYPFCVFILLEYVIYQKVGDCPLISACVAYVGGHKPRRHSVSLEEPPDNGLGTLRPQPDLVTNHAGESSRLYPFLFCVFGIPLINNSKK